MDFLPDIEKFKNFFDGTDSKNEISIAVEEAKKYDIFNLISRVSALNLFHQNQTKSVILDTYIEGVLCQTRDQFPSKYTISSGKFRKIINQISDTSLKYSIDPPENMFVQNIMFYGNYRVLNGIDQTPAYNLQHMISVLFAKGIEYPKEFLDATYILVNGMLEISEKIVGGILNTENNHDTDEEKSIMIPSAMELNKYTELVIINGADFRKLFLNRIELLDLVTIEFGVQFEGDFDNKSFYTRPFLYNEEKDQYILLNAGLLPTAIVFWITCLAKKYGIFEEVLENYNDYIFHECQKYLCNLGHKKVLESQMSIDLFSSSGYKEYIASVQNNQLVIVQYLYDDGKNYNACTLHSTIEKKEFNDVVSKRLSYHYSKIIEYGVEKEDIFVIIIINSLGRGMAYGIKKYDYCYPPLRIHPFELMCISINEKAENVFIPRYLKAKNNLQTFETGILSELNQIEIYCNNNYSFYMNDEFAPREVTTYFAPGDSLDYIIRAIQKEDRRLVEDAYGTRFVEVVLNDEKRKIYVDPNCAKSHEIRYYIEFKTFNIWIVAKEISNVRKIDLCYSLVDLISYWLSECRIVFDQIDGCGNTYEIQILLSDGADQYYYYKENPKSFSETLEISNLFPVMEICVSPEAFQYLNYCDNSREKELIAIIIDHICKLVGKIDKINYDLNALFPNPIQKKIFSLDYQEYHYFEPTENRENHFVHGEDEDILLNEIGEEILEVENWNIGIVDDEDRTKIVHEVVGILYKKLQQEVSFNEKIVGLIIDSIALRQREDFLVPPEPFRKEDVYPWRFNRELSFTRRPIIIRGDEMIWGNRQLDHMIRFTLGLINNGKLKAHSSKMNSLVGRISDERGAEFNDFIYKILVNFNVFEVYPNISKVNGVYIAENNNTLGDIDVLIIDREYHKIIAAEVKNFNFSKNPYEMHLEYKKMFENTKKKKGYYTKHCRRVDWCNKHIDDFKKQYGLDDGDWRVIGVFILSQPLVSTEIYHKEIKMLTEKELSVSSIRNIY